MLSNDGLQVLEKDPIRFLGVQILQAASAFWTVEGLEVWSAFSYGSVTMGQYPLAIYRGDAAHALEIPAGYEVQIRPRSGLALNHAITLPNAPATIDPGYRGELKVILLNLGKSKYEVHAGDRIAQMVLARYEAVEWQEGDLAESLRGHGGFGSSGR